MRQEDAETQGHREKNLNSNVEINLSASPRLRVFASEINWMEVKRVLVVRLRSIGDTVLATPSLIALKRFLPDTQIDILLEDWVAPVLENFDAVDNVLTVGKDKKSRIETAWKIRRNKYDVVFNLHGGTTATFFVRASGAKHRVGFRDYQYSFLYTHLAPSSSEFWQTEHTHSAEQQLALLGFVGVPVADKPKSRLIVTQKADSLVQKRLEQAVINLPFALIHPSAAFESKQWKPKNFARVIEFLDKIGIQSVVVSTPQEEKILNEIFDESSCRVTALLKLTLPEITALAARAKIFVGNDSGIAHIAAAVETPSVVIFGSSNINNWRPWTNAPNEIVYEKMPCQPCAGYFCKEFAEPECIKRVSVESVIEAIKKVLR